MKPRLLLALLSLSLAAAPSLRALPQQPEQEKHTELGDKMEKMNKAWRKLRRQVADPAKNADSLALIATMKTALAGADKLRPDKETDLPEAARAKFQADFVAGMKKLATGFDRLEAALKANNNEEAEKIIKDLGDLQKDSHKTFRRPPPEKSGPPSNRKPQS